MYASWTFISPLLQKKFGSFPHFSYQSLSILWKNAKTVQSFLAKQLLTAWTHQIQAFFALSNHLSEMFLSSKLTHRFEVRVIFVLGQLWKVELISKEGNRISTHTSLGQSITSKCKRKCKCKELLLWTTPTQMQTQASTQGIKNFHFLELAFAFASYTCE